MIRLLIDFEYEIGKQKLPMQQLNFNAKELRQENWNREKNTQRQQIVHEIQIDMYVNKKTFGVAFL